MAGASTTRCSGLDRRGLDDRPAEIAGQQFQAAVGAERSCRGTQHARASPLALACRSPRQPCRLELGLLAIARKPPARRRSARRRAADPRPAVRRSRSPCRPRRGSGSRRPCRWDRPGRAAGRRPTGRRRSSQSITIPAARAMATRWIV